MDQAVPVEDFILEILRELMAVPLDTPPFPLHAGACYGKDGAPARK